MHAALAADAGVLHAAEGRAQVAQEPGVDPHDAGLELRRHAVRAGQVRAPDRRRQAVIGVVGQFQHLFFGVERRHRHHRAEDFLALGLAIAAQTHDHGRLQERALGQMRRQAVRTLAAGQEGGAIGLGRVQEALHARQVLARDQRAQRGGRIGRIAHLHRAADALDQLVQKRLVQRALHVDARTAQAHLALIGEGRAHGRFDTGVEVCVGKDQVRVLAAQLEGQLLQAAGRRAHDDLPGGGLAGEGDAVHVRVFGQGRAGRIAAKAVHHVQHARRQDVLGHVRQQRRGGRCFFRRLDDDGVAAGQRRGDLPGGQQQREVPRRDDADHAQRPAQGVIQRPFHLPALGGDVLEVLGELDEVGTAARDVDVAGQRDRHAVVGHFGGRELGGARLDAVRQLHQQIHAPGHGHLAPRALERRAGGGDRLVDFRLAALMHLGDNLAGGRVDVVEGAPAGRGDELTVDEVFDLFHVTCFRSRVGGAFGTRIFLNEKGRSRPFS
nr:K624 [uncultured bacterium]